MRNVGIENKSGWKADVCGRKVKQEDHAWKEYGFVASLLARLIENGRWLNSSAGDFDVSNFGDMFASFWT